MNAGTGGIIEARGLSKSFAGFAAVSNVDLTIRPGTIHALIGPNGAGKTTTFNLITRFLNPSAGTIFYRGKDITGLSPSAVARGGMVRSFQISAIFGRMSARDNIRMALQSRAGLNVRFWQSGKDLDAFNGRADELLAAVGLERQSGQLAADLSYGRRRALEIATTLALEPDVMLLDEPTSGLGAEDVSRIATLIRQAAKDRTVVLVEHNLAVVADLCDRITVMTRGRVLCEGDYATVSADPRVIEAYIGGIDG